jgi:UDP-4-amino-4,6-dideoxy-N-acetyl-beta-L-altrosamine transaminase
MTSSSSPLIPYGRQNISEADIAAVVEVLRSPFLTQGPVVPNFENAVAAKVGARYAVAVNSATSALHIACLALGLGQGDRLWTSPNTFVASANCARYCGATVDFVDIDPHTYNISINQLCSKLKQAEKDNKLPKIVVPVHYAGQPCDMEAIHALSRQYGFKIIEDASHAIGASNNNIKVGSCIHSDITVFSFHPVKIITSGEGGMLLTNDAHLDNCLRRLRTHGVSHETELMHVRPIQEIWNYQQIELGYNYRMSDIHAALGLSQLKNLDYFVASRHRIAYHYDVRFASLPITTPFQSQQTYSSYHLYPIRIEQDKAKKSQRQIYDALRKKNIAVNLHYIPVHLQPYYQDIGFKYGDFPEAEQFFRETITLPIFPGLSESHQELIIDALSAELIHE